MRIAFVYSDYERREKFSFPQITREVKDENGAWREINYILAEAEIEHNERFELTNEFETLDGFCVEYEGRSGMIFKFLIF